MGWGGVGGGAQRLAEDAVRKHFPYGGTQGEKKKKRRRCVCMMTESE